MAAPALVGETLLPQLRGVVELGARQLGATVVVVFDDRHDPPALVACEGPEREDLLARAELVDGLRDARAGGGQPAGLEAFGSLATIDVRPGPARRIARVCVLGDPGDPNRGRTLRRGHTQALVRQIALVLTCPGDAPSPRQGPDTGPGDRWLTRLDALPSLPDAVGRLTPTVSDGLSALVGADAACLVVWDEERSILRALPGSFGTTDRALSDSISGPPTNPHSVTSRVFNTGQPYLANEAAGDLTLHRHYVDVFGLRRAIAVPLTVGSHRAGVLIAANKPAPFTVEDVLELERLAPRIATAIQLTLSIEKIRRSQRMDRILAQAATDVATGRGVEDCLRPALAALGGATGSAMAVLSLRTAAQVIWRAGRVEAGLEREFLTAAQGTSLRAAGAYPHDVGDPGWATVHAPVMFSGDLVAAVSLLRRNGIPFGTDEEEALGRLADVAALAWASDRYQRQLAELARSRERARIADELHDHVAQILFAAQIGVDSLLDHEGAETGEVHERLHEIRALLTTGEATVRAVIDECAPAPQANLVRRLRSTAAAIDEQFRAHIDLELPDAAAVAGIPRPVADCVVKVAHEATINAVKHAGPGGISVSLRHTGDVLTLRVRDAGVGAPPAGFTSRYGIDSMTRAAREVGASLAITRRTGTPGTQVKLSLALEL